MSTIIYQRNDTTIYLQNSKIYKVIYNKNGFSVTGIRELAFFKSGLQHPNILNLLNYALVPGMICMELPKAEGDLTIINIPNEHKNSIALQLLNAVRYLHIHKVMHRDIKPGNILIFKNGEEYTAKLADFGTNRYMPAPWIGGFTIEVCTRWYKAPEIIVGKNYDFTSDIWSLACTILEMYDGLPLFNGDTNEQVLEKIYGFRSKTGRYHIVFTKLHHLYPKLSKLMDSMLQINPEFRIKFCEDIAISIPTLKLSTSVNVEKLLSECGALGLSLETFWKALTFISVASKDYWDTAIFLASKISETYPMETKYLCKNYPFQETVLLQKVIDILYIPSPLELAIRIKELDYDSVAREFRKLVLTNLIYTHTNVQLGDILVKIFQVNLPLIEFYLKIFGVN